MMLRRRHSRTTNQPRRKRQVPKWMWTPVIFARPKQSTRMEIERIKMQKLSSSLLSLIFCSSAAVATTGENTGYHVMLLDPALSKAHAQKLFPEASIYDRADTL